MEQSRYARASFPANYQRVYFEEGGGHRQENE